DLAPRESLRGEPLRERRFGAGHRRHCFVDFRLSDRCCEKERKDHSFSTSIERIAELTTKIRSFLLRSSGYRKNPLRSGLYCATPRITSPSANSTASWLPCAGSGCLSGFGWGKNTALRLANGTSSVAPLSSICITWRSISALTSVARRVFPSRYRNTTSEPGIIRRAPGPTNRGGE